MIILVAESKFLLPIVHATTSIKCVNVIGTFNLHACVTTTDNEKMMCMNLFSTQRRVGRIFAPQESLGFKELLELN